MYKENSTHYLSIFGDDFTFNTKKLVFRPDYSYEAHQWLLYRLFENDVFQFYANVHKIRKRIRRVVY